MRKTIIPLALILFCALPAAPESRGIPPLSVEEYNFLNSVDRGIFDAAAGKSGATDEQRREAIIAARHKILSRIPAQEKPAYAALIGSPSTSQDALNNFIVRTSGRSPRSAAATEKKDDSKKVKKDGGSRPASTFAGDASRDLTFREKEWYDYKRTPPYPGKGSSKMPAFLTAARDNILNSELPSGSRGEYRAAINPPVAEKIDKALIHAVELDEKEQAALKDLKLDDTIRSQINLKDKKPNPNGAPKAKFDTSLKSSYATVLEFYKDAMSPYTKGGQTDPKLTRNPSIIVEKFRAVIPPPTKSAPAGPVVGPGVFFPHHDVIAYYLFRYDQTTYKKYMEERQAIENDAALSPEEKKRRLDALKKKYADLIHSAFMDKARKDPTLFRMLTDAQKNDLCKPYVKSATAGTPAEIQAKQDFRSNEIRAYNQAMEIAKQSGKSDTAAYAQGWHGSAIDDSLPSDVKAQCIAFLFSTRDSKSTGSSDLKLSGPESFTDLQDKNPDGKPWYTKLDKTDAANLKAGVAGAMVGALIGTFFAFPAGPIIGAAIGGATFFGANWLLNKQP